MLTPPDLQQCQAEKPTAGPFTMGGEVGNLDGHRVRCKETPTLIATQKRPGGDGLRGSMSLCKGCYRVLLKQAGEDFVTVSAIE